MLKNKIVVLSLVVAGFFAGMFLVSFSPSIEAFAERLVRTNTRFENNWEYCVITRIGVDNPTPEQLVNFVGNVQIDYFQYSFNNTISRESYVKNECIKHELNYAEFLQENNLKNLPQSRIQANERAADLALAKALTKLGNAGWEMTGHNFANFHFETASANSSYKNSLYFRRHVGQKSASVSQP